MNNKAKSVIKNLYYTVGANFATLLISVLLNLFVPKILGVKEYSYWQLYVFYSSYVGFLHFGWIDGIYLKIGGEEYNDLDKRSLGSQYWYLLMLEVCFSLGITMYTLFFVAHTNKSLILILTACVSFITIAKTFIQYILQSTNRIREYAHLSRSDRYLYVVLLVIFFLFGGRTFSWLIIIDIFSKLCVTIWGMYQIRDMLTIKLISLNKIIKEIIDNISIGSKLMLSNIASMLILGIIRFFVQNKWSIEVFGKLSFTLSISNMFLTFINAIGVVMFPLLRRTNKDRIASLFLVLRTLFVPLTYFLLFFYIPIKEVLVIWLPQYSVSLMYMGILFPMIIFEGRMSLLINTYLKTLRKEKYILFVNVVTLSVSAIGGVVIVYLVQNLLLAVGLIIFCLALRCILAEKILAGFLKINLNVQQAFEIVLALMFILGNVFFTDILSFIAYTVCYVIYIIMFQRDIRKALSDFLLLVKS
ncbi:hypothetical protein NRIC_18000 [Enterococcus florum]|uniref:Uncharacterized protein n=1 Tax=Enterococcus florum TaxID=2480627 RepID=A0A4V0WPH8_9ENTE|nr:hypothetical protein [Enterococcus florum]GCF93909.1 hypothetical protein NRIC_18000 [Enterococcus florum]